MATLLFQFSSQGELTDDTDGVWVLVSIYSLANDQRLLKEWDGNCGLLDTDISRGEIVNGCCIAWMLITDSIASKFNCFTTVLQSLRPLIENPVANRHVIHNGSIIWILFKIFHHRLGLDVALQGFLPLLLIKVHLCKPHQ